MYACVFQLYLLGVNTSQVLESMFIVKGVIFFFRVWLALRLIFHQPIHGGSAVSAAQQCEKPFIGFTTFAHPDLESESYTNIWYIQDIQDVSLNLTSQVHI